jgi:hypothetical protein
VNRHRLLCGLLLFACSLSVLRAQQGAALSTGQAEHKAPVTALDRYKTIVYLAVGSIWYHKIAQSFDLLPVGSVSAKYTIHSDGKVEVTMAAPGDPPLDKFKTLCLGSVMEASPFPAFSEALRKEVGESFSDEFTFSVYADPHDPSGIQPKLPHAQVRSAPARAPALVPTPSTILPGVD